MKATYLPSSVFSTPRLSTTQALFVSPINSSHQKILPKFPTDVPQTGIYVKSNLEIILAEWDNILILLCAIGIFGNVPVILDSQ